MRVKTALIPVAVALVLGAAALTLALRSGVSLGFATPYIEKKASQLIGRHVFFEQAPRLQLKSGLRVSIKDVSVQNADWAGPDDFLELQSLSAHIQLASLLDDQIVIETLALDGLQLRLSIDAQGRGNIPKLETNDTPAEASTGDKHPLPVAIRHMQIRNVRVDRANAVTGQTVALVLDNLDQLAPDTERLTINGQGSLQGRPWDISVDGSSFMSLRTGRDMSANFAGSLGELKLTGDYRLPDLRALENLTLHAQLDGPVPERIAALSPLLEANEPAHLALEVRDVTPGIDLNLQLVLTQLNMLAKGSIDDPQSADGIDLAVTLKSASLGRLTQAVGLGEAPDLPLTLEGRVLREGNNVALLDGNLVAGEHRVQADIRLPQYPGTDGATLKLSATGPDFALYQSLAGLTPNLTVPYSLDARISRNSTAGEAVTGTLSIGEHRLSMSGIIDNFPNYAGSQLELDIVSPSLQTLARSAGLELPDTAITGKSALAVSKDAIIEITSAELTAFGTTSRLSGHVNSYPDFDNADLHMSMETASLAALGQRLGLQTLDDVPASFGVDIQGKPEDIVIRNPALNATGLRLQSSQGELRYRNKVLTSNLLISTELSNIPTLLGISIPDAVPTTVATGSYRFDLLPRLSDTLFSLALENLSGPGISGSAKLELTRDFSLNDQTRLQADLLADDLSQLLPRINGYSPPQQTLRLSAVTRPEPNATHIDAQLMDGGTPLLSAGIIVPRDLAAQDITLSLSGSGADVRVFGSSAQLPDQLLPYAVDLAATLRGQTLTLNARRLRIGETEILGKASWAGSSKSLSADIKVPKARLQSWLAAREHDAKDHTAASAPTDTRADKRVIPDINLPLDFLQTYHMDVSLETGPLGIADPKFAARSLVDEAKLRWQIGDGKGQLRIDTLRGSRGTHTADIRIDATQAPALLSSDIRMDQVPLSVISAVTDFDSLPRYDFTTSLSARGANLRELAATLNGELFVAGSEGTLKKMKLSMATESFLAQLFRTVLPMLSTDEANMQIECSVMGARARDGIVLLQPGFVMRSRELDLSAQGQIDLGNEKLSISFNNLARQGLGISATSLFTPFVAITGTLAKPTLGLDIKNAAISGGAAFASAGVTILAKPIFERLRPRENPCERASKEWLASGD